MSNVLVLQHVDCETPGLIGECLRQAGIATHVVRGDLGQRIPESLGGFDGLLVMGGPQSVYEQEQFPFLTAELRLIESALTSNTPLLGVCLGSQLLAAALGATVRPGKQKEIGWLPITLSPEAHSDRLWQGAPSPLQVLHWHGDVFDLPRDATALASSALTPLQAFRHGRNAYGLLFHMEVTATMLSEWVRKFSGELQKCGLDGNAILAAAQTHMPAAHAAGREVYTRWLRSICRTR